MRVFTIAPKFVAMAVMALALLSFSTSEARADEVFIAGFTNGCFGAGCTPGASASFLGLTYSNSTFAGTTANGFRGLGGNPAPGGNFNNLGSFTLSNAPATYDGQTFTLQVTFTAPQGITGSNQTTLVATLLGTVAADNQGGLFIMFPNQAQTFSFNDTNCEPDPTGGVVGQNTTCGQGSFNFAVNSFAIDPFQTEALTGQITSAQQRSATVPEPASLLLLGSGISGLAGYARRRYRRNKE